MDILIMVILGYVFGSIPWALIIGKVFYKTDIRQHGSGNLGGTNAGRVLGKKAGISVALMDSLKGFIAIAIAVTFFSKEAGIAAGLAAAFGHCYPIFANFKGGKAVSTAFGYLLGVSVFITGNPQFLFLIPLVTFFAILKLTKIVSLSSMISVTLAAILTYFLQPDLYVFLAMVVIAALVIWRHRSNVQRILNNSERKITWM
ncbi:MAG: glycerol-3-phosphate 1-O-acyltransferase PlsY [Erysipelothrix sp.]|jgi:acyl phosphate:glycerol-3-phosphate acyltransferase|nr:glycerol-3-phosphate 1-O-acyltransferase PlsY [Erysipelothrix sp.]